MKKHSFASFSLFVILLFSSCNGNNDLRADDNNNNWPDIDTEITQYSGYDLVWNDEFDASGAPNKYKWAYELGYVRNSEPQLYTKDNAWVEKGRLYIEASYKDGVLTSSSIETKGKADFLYGKIQARIKIPVGNSAWPAFWTLGSTRRWPDQGEVDIMEFYRYGKDTTPTILGNAFWVAKNGVDVIDDTGTVPLSYFTDKDPDWANKFHIWTEDWTEDEIKIYVDDYLVNTIDLSQTSNQGGDHVGENPLRQPHYLKLNLALRGRDNDPVDSKAIPMHMEVDWVRVYKAKDDTGISEKFTAKDIVRWTYEHQDTSTVTPYWLDGDVVCIKTRANTYDRAKLHTDQLYQDGTYTWKTYIPEVGKGDMTSIGSWIYCDDNHEVDFEVGYGTEDTRKTVKCKENQLVACMTNQSFPNKSGYVPIDPGWHEFSIKLNIYESYGKKDQYYEIHWYIDGEEKQTLKTTYGPNNATFRIYVSVENLKFIGSHIASQDNVGKFEWITFQGHKK